MATRYIVVLAAVLAVIYAQAEPVDEAAPQKTLIAPTVSSEAIEPVKPEAETQSEVAEAQPRDKRAPILLAKALVGGALLGKAALGAGVIGAGVLGAKAIGAGVLGAGILGAGALGAGLYKAK